MLILLPTNLAVKIYMAVLVKNLEVVSIDFILLPTNIKFQLLHVFTYMYINVVFLPEELNHFKHHCFEYK